MSVRWRERLADITCVWSVECPLNDRGSRCRIGSPPSVEKAEGVRRGPPPAKEEI
jgi:hypothetical protein